MAPLGMTPPLLNRTRLVDRYRRAITIFFLLSVSALAHAQGGPPLVTDDPDTPGDRHWEINLATLIEHERSGGGRSTELDADINYGWGERIQLKVDVPLSRVSEAPVATTTGMGSTVFGVKWRFFDGGDYGLKVSTYPQFSTAWTASAVQRGLADSLRSYFLPIEVAKTVGLTTWVGEVGRSFVSDGSHEWMAGLVAARAVREGTTALMEVHQTRSVHGDLCLLNIGLRQELGHRLSVLTSVGHEFGPVAADPRGLLLYAGIQIRR